VARYLDAQSATNYFRKAFVAPRASMTLYVKADDQFTAYLNGVKICDGSNWSQVFQCPVSLNVGDNDVLAVESDNFGGGPGSLLVDLR
jgi:hypothetical protein